MHASRDVIYEYIILIICKQV